MVIAGADARLYEPVLRDIQDGGSSDDQHHQDSQRNSYFPQHALRSTHPQPAMLTILWTVAQPCDGARVLYREWDR
jgi:hypothetical protein